MPLPEEHELSSILHGVVAFVHCSDAASASSIKAALRGLGAKVAKSLTRDASHVIFVKLLQADASQRCKVCFLDFGQGLTWGKVERER